MPTLHVDVLASGTDSAETVESHFAALLQQLGGAWQQQEGPGCAALQNRENVRCRVALRLSPEGTRGTLTVQAHPYATRLHNAGLLFTLAAFGAAFLLVDAVRAVPGFLMFAAVVVGAGVSAFAMNQVSLRLHGPRALTVEAELFAAVNTALNDGNIGLRARAG
jgi:hypothetical protein